MAGLLAKLFHQYSLVLEKKKEKLNVPNDTDGSSRSAVMPPAKRWFCMG